METNNIINEYELNKLLGFFNPEVVSFQLQHMLLSKGIKINQEDCNLEFSLIIKKMFNTSYISYEFQSGIYRLLKYSPDFQKKTDKIIFFKDDDFCFENSQNEKFVFSFNTIVMWKVKNISLSEVIPLGEYTFSVQKKQERESMLSYLERINVENEFYQKNNLYSNIYNLFNKGYSNDKIKHILQQRLTYFNIHCDQIYIPLYNKNPTIMLHNFIQNNPHVININLNRDGNSLMIQSMWDNFYKNISNKKFSKAIKSNNSYFCHIEKLIKKIRYYQNN